MLKQALRFGLVGGVSTLFHMAVGVTLIGFGWPPLGANAIAFMAAFLVSFTGHYRFSFAEHSKTLATSFRRFILVALAGFAVNEILLGLFTYTGILPASVALVVSTATAAAGTFILSRKWAFAHSEGQKLDNG
jgi:putative flippase GtrA